MRKAADVVKATLIAHMLWDEELDINMLRADFTRGLETARGEARLERALELYEACLMYFGTCRMGKRTEIVALMCLATCIILPVEYLQVAMGHIRAIFRDIPKEIAEMFGILQAA